MQIYANYLVGPGNADRRRIRLDAALEVDVVALADGVRIQVTTQFQFHRRSI